MKLKKVVSLALAGVMAVSMLAGCATKQEEPTQEPTEEVVETGYSAEFGEYVDTDNEVVSFQDNDTDAVALQSFVDYYSDAALAGYLGTAGWLNGGTTAAKAFVKDAGLDAYTYKMEDTANMNVAYKTGKIYAADGSISLDKALEMAAADYKSTIDALLKSDSDTNGGSYDYSYVVSVSVVNRAANMVATDYSVNFIAVTITRTGVPATV